MFAQYSPFLNTLVMILIVLFLITECQRLPKTGINLKRLTKNGKQTPRPAINNNKNSGFLSIKNGYLFYKKRKLFLSGTNVIYVNLGQDFGDGNYKNVKTQYESYTKQISNAGGNSISVVVHGDGNTTPRLDSDGFATGEDTASLVKEIGIFLDTAKKNNIFVILNLWTAEYNIASDNIKDLFRQQLKLNSYINKVLKPLVSALKKKQSLAMYVVITDPSGSVMKNIVDSNPCHDTQDLTHQFASWSSNNFTMKEMQCFINRQIAAIKATDPKALVTVLSNVQESSGLCDWCYNYWQNKCLISAGGKSNGVLDIYNFDSFVMPGFATDWNPMRKKATDYKLGKPILIGVSSANCSVTNNAITNFNYAFNNGYVGILGWRYNPGSTGICTDSPVVCDSAMSALKSKTSVRVNIK